MNLDFNQAVEKVVKQVHVLANKFLTGDYAVSIAFVREDLEEGEVGGAIAGTASNEDALALLEDSVEDEDESDIVVRSR